MPCADHNLVFRLREAFLRQQHLIDRVIPSFPCTKIAGSPVVKHILLHEFLVILSDLIDLIPWSRYHMAGFIYGRNFYQIFQYPRSVCWDIQQPQRVSSTLWRGINEGTTMRRGMWMRADVSTRRIRDLMPSVDKRKCERGYWPRVQKLPGHRIPTDRLTKI